MRASSSGLPPVTIGQKQAALALLDSEAVLVPKSVVLETEWVLRSRYSLRPAEIHAFLHHLVESENVIVEDEPAVRRALQIYEAGADFADALHLASAGDLRLHTFDRDFCRKAISKGVAPRVEIVRAASGPTKRTRAD